MCIQNNIEIGLKGCVKVIIILRETIVKYQLESSLIFMKKKFFVKFNFVTQNKIYDSACPNVLLLSKMLYIL